MQKLISLARKAINDYNMIQEGDKIAVGISGGKDSIALLAALANYRKFAPYHFDLIGININVGFEDLDRKEVDTLIKYCKDEFDVDLIVEDTDIKQIVFDERKETNPCSLCSKMRRGALNTVAIKNGCNKIALGHHADDVLDTFLLSFIYEGRLSTFAPVSYMSRSDITLIRPFIYVEEKNIKGVVNRYNFPVIHNPCPEDKHTERESTKELVKMIENKFGYCKTRMLSALFHPERNNLWDKVKATFNVEDNKD